MKNRITYRRSLFFAALTCLLYACAGQPGREDYARATAGYVEDVNKLFVVDCLLPGQVRKLGTQMTYLSPRRPMRTTAADCEVRGGEYVAYDRANIDTALKIWRPKAEEGDAEAQLHVGEIYEKGMGQPVDHVAAAKWYRKAADQGNAQAQINLGHLYEQGLGAPKDMAAAMQWYRKASHLDQSDLQFASAVDARESQQQELQALREETQRSRNEAETLRTQLREAQQQIVEQQEDLRKSQNELDQARQYLSREKSSPSADSGAVSRLEDELKQKQALLESQQNKLSRMSATLSQERKRMAQQLAAAHEQNKAKQGKTADSTPAPDQARSLLAATEKELAARIDSYQKKSAELTQWLTQPGSDPGARQRIDARKLELQNEAREIALLKDKEEQQTHKLSEQGKQGALASSGPDIQILQPTLTQTRGMPSIQLNASARELVGKIVADEGLKSFSVNGKAQTLDAAGMFKVPLGKDAASAPLHIVAIDKKSRQAELIVNLVNGDASPAPSESASNRPNGPEPLTGIEFGHFRALIIGNNGYTAYPTLKTAVSDAKSVEVILRERYGFKTKLLLNANRYAIMSALNELNKQLGEQDNVLIYYAGHGEIDKPTQSAYWLPIDAEKANTANWISSQSITEFVSIMPAKHVMVVADSCYSGALTGSAVAKLPDGMDESKRIKWLKVMATRKARTVLTSGGVQPVLDQGGGEHSVFANAFLSVLRSNQRVLEDYDIYREVARQVRSASVRQGFAQSPQYAPLQHAGHEGSPFFFVPSS